MGLFLVTCTRTRAWTPASGPKTFLSARGTNTRVPKSVSFPLHVAKLAFQAVFPGRLRTAGCTHSLAWGISWAKWRPEAIVATGPVFSPTPASPLLRALLAPTPHYPALLAPHYTLGHRPLLTPFSVSHTFPTKSWLCVKFLCQQHILSVVQSPLSPLCYSACRMSSLLHLPFKAPCTLTPTCLSHFIFSHFFSYSLSPSLLSLPLQGSSRRPLTIL